MRRSGCGRINTEAFLEQASGRVHSPVDRFKTKGGVSGEDNETRAFPADIGITGRPELGIGICVICETCPLVPRRGRQVCGLEGVSQFKHEIDPRHGHVTGKLTRAGR